MAAGDDGLIHATELAPRVMAREQEVKLGGGSFHAFGKIDRLVGQAIKAREPTLMVGPTGCGKSEKAELLIKAWLDCVPYVMSLHGEMSVDDFLGTKELVNGDTIFRYGPMLHAMLERLPMLIDEVDAAAPEVLFFLHRILERKPVCLPCVNGEAGAPLVINPWREEDGSRSRFTIVATANTLGRGDMSGLYRGTQVLNEAFLDRWWVFPIAYLRRSVARLTTAGLQVIGIGICSEAVSQFYPEYVVVNELEDLMREGYGKVSQQLRRARTG